MKTNEEFFDSISSFYDKMINFDAAIQRRKEALQNFIDPYMKSAADMGSGTGLDSIALSLLGLEVTGFDISSKMIEQAEINAGIYNTEIRFVQAELDKIPSDYSGKFNLIVSLGNTLANLSKDKINKAVANSFEMLRSKGKLVMQILNFEYVKGKNERIINITEKDSYYYIRFYDFFDKEINFNILKFHKEAVSQRELITTRLFIYTSSELNDLLTEKGYKNINLYENLSGKNFEPEASKDLVITAEK